MGICDAKLDILNDVFARHYGYYITQGGETIEQQKSGEGALELQYSGRAIFELVQNALDISERIACVMLRNINDKLWLFIANDGNGITVDPDYDYKRGSSGNKRSDFNALCSIHTSNKSPDENFGNKGVGFRSVFSVADQVQVWSKLIPENDGWWGFELRNTLTPDKCADLLSENQREIRPAGLWIDDKEIQRLRSHPSCELHVPSFYFPIPRYASNTPEIITEGVGSYTPTTVICFPVESEKICATVKATVKELRESRLHFVGLRRNNIEVRVEDLDCKAVLHTRQEDGWTLLSWNTDVKAGEWECLAQTAKLDIRHPGAAIAWPPKIEKSSTPSTLFCYLPTQVSGAFAIDLHGDFQMSIDRKTLQIRKEESAGPYNSKLIEAAAELHLLCVIRELGLDATLLEWKVIQPEQVQGVKQTPATPRADLWRLLTPPDYVPSESKEFAPHHLLAQCVQKRLFPDSRFDVWRKLAEGFFSAGREWPKQSFDAFWYASARWLPWLTSYGNWTKTNYGKAEDLCKSLREVEAFVIPLTGDEQKEGEKLKAVCLPDKEERRKVYLIRQDTFHFKLPQAMIKNDVAVTTYVFPPPFGIDLSIDKSPTGVKSVDRWTIFQEFRQLPARITDQQENQEQIDPDPDAAIVKQRELIELALFFYKVKLGKETTPADSPENFGVGWRAIDNNLMHQRAGRALSTLHLPTKKGSWEPARQLTWSDVDESVIWRNETICNSQQFLTFLGVNPDGGGQRFALVEDGEQGLVLPKMSPPSLVSLKSGERPPDLTIVLLPNSENPEPKWESPGIIDGVRALWGHLKPLIVHEMATHERDLATIGTNQKETPIRSKVRQFLSQTPWVYLDGRYVAPESMVILPSKDRRSKVLDTPPLLANENPVEREMWIMLGALPGLEKEYLVKENAKPAYLLLASLQCRRGLTNNDLAKGLESDSQQALQEAFSTLFNAACGKPQPDKEVPLLIYKGSDRQSSTDYTPLIRRQLAWDTDTRSAYVVTKPRDREIVARHFPHLPIVAAVLDTGVKELTDTQHPLASQILEVGIEIKYDEEIHEENNRSGVYKNILESFLPGLLALANLSPLATPRPVPECRELWSKLKFRHVRNVWGVYRLMADGKEIANNDDPRKNSYGDVLWKENKGEEEISEIIFDGAEDGSETNSPPPLSEFGEPLAALVVGNRVFSDLFSRVLGLTDLKEPENRKRFDAFLIQRMADSLARELALVFSPLTKEQEQRFLAHVSAALAEVGLVFRTDSTEKNWRNLLRLDQDSISPLNNDSWPVRTAWELQVRLNQFPWEEFERGIVPQVEVGDRNDRKLKQWWKDNTISLQNLMDYLGWELAERNEEMKSIEASWNDFITEARQRLDFDPEQLIGEWIVDKLGLKALVPSLSDLKTKVRDFRPDFKPVTGIKPGGGIIDCTSRLTGGPCQIERAAQDSTEYARQAAEKELRGRKAEEQLVHYITRETYKLLSKHDSGKCWEVLFNSIPTGGKIEAVLKEAHTEWNHQRSEEALRKALWISNIWGSAGFDILGLEEKNGSLMPVRYECKALPGNSGTFQVFLSANELKVFRKVRSVNLLPCPGHPELRYLGEWKLIGVVPDGRGFDLTGLLDHIAVSDMSLLEPLARQGLTPDAFILRFSLS